MHSPDRLTLPLMVQSGEGATAPDADAKRIALALGVEAQLIHRRRVDPAKADSGVADLDVVALADFWHAGDFGGLRHRRQQQQHDRKQEFHDHVKAAVFNTEPYSMSNRIS